MSPEDLAAVDRSWTELRHRKGEIVERLEVIFSIDDPCDTAAVRAKWLVDAVDELVGLLSAPSRLGASARRLATSWPVACTAPAYSVEGWAWMHAACDLCPSWTDATERAWKHAWLLLADELAEEALSPFAAPTAVDRS